MKDIIKFWLIIFAVFVLLVTLIFGAANLLVGASCDAQWKDSGMQHRYSFFGGCQVKRNGVWIPAGNYRDTEK
jgi:hypothetical protein